MVINGDAAPETFDGADISYTNLKIEWMLTPDTAVLLSKPGLAYDANRTDKSVDAQVPTVQYEVKPVWWINSGVGLSVNTPVFYLDDKKCED